MQKSSDHYNLSRLFYDRGDISSEIAVKCCFSKKHHRELYKKNIIQEYVERKTDRKQHGRKASCVKYIIEEMIPFLIFTSVVCSHEHHSEASIFIKKKEKKIISEK